MTDASAAAVQVADHVAHVFLGRDRFHVHDRFEHDRAGFPDRFLKGETPRHLERDFRTIHFVVGTVGDLDPDIHHRITTEHTRQRGFANAVLNGADVFTRNSAANDLVFHHNAAAFFNRFYFDDGVTVLTTT